MRETVRNLARVGLLARGAVYFLIGMLALMVVLQTPGGRTTDTRGAMRELLREPMGYALLVLLAIGLVSYAIWRVLESIYDYDENGTGFTGFCMRFGQIFVSAVYVAFGVYALNLVFLFTRSNERQSEQKMVRLLFQMPFGDWLVGIAGIGTIVFGFGQMYIARQEAFRSYIYLPKKAARFILPICKFGLVARGVVFVLIGSFFVNAAWKHSPREAGGFKEAWAALRAQPHGDLLMGIVALGFVAYAFYSAVEAIYRRE